MSGLEGFPHSQLSLKTYRECPLRFRRRYLDRMWWSREWGADEEQRGAIRTGQEFHLLASRHFWGMPRGTASDDAVAGWLAALEEFAPRRAGCRYLPEQELRTAAGEGALVAKYDLLELHPDGHAVIYDWKTSPQPPQAGRLARDLQTRLYRAVLCRAGTALGEGGWAPAAVSMVYWNPRFPTAPVRLPYSTAAYRRDWEHLTRLVAEIAALGPGDFPATTREETCRRCEYRPLCRGEAREGTEPPEAEVDDAAWELSWEAVPELPL